MSGRPDYDAGDLVVCLAVDDVVQPVTLIKGRIYQVSEVFFHPLEDRWAVRLVGVVPPRGYSAYNPDYFRKIDPKPPEFFAGTIDADLPEQVPA